MRPIGTAAWRFAIGAAASAAPLEELDLAFVLLGFHARLERAQVAPLAGL